MKNEHMRARRLAKGLTLGKLSKVVDISETNLAYYERGQRVPSVYRAIRIANALRCKVEDIFKGNI